MAIIKCKMCGGDLPLTEGMTVCECEYCGTRQTIPKFDNEKKLNLYDRANHFRRNNEFDKAEGIYEKILDEDPTDAESYWSLVLCRYGIEYVEDPASHKRVPTVNRAQYTSIYADENYKKALEYSDTLQKTVYEAEAKAIDDIQKGILEISSKEEPFDVFICYKETDDQGRRTRDSVNATELYHALTNEGFKVFFSRITLEDKLGTAYEPYIFAALNSAKVMVVLGTKPEHFNAVWVKNEWSRYLSLIQSGAKKTLIPAYRDMDPYDLPEEFSHLQSQDMSKLGFLQDLVRGIKKIIGEDQPAPQAAPQQVVMQSAGGVNLTAQIKRGMIALEDGDWTAADGFFDKALDMDAECAEAYFGKALAAAKCATGDALADQRLSMRGTDGKKLTACEKDTARISEAVATYTVPGYLSAEDISSCFAFDDREYDSLTEAKEKRLASEKAWWEQDRMLSRAVRYAAGDFAGKLKSMRKQLEAGLERDLTDSRERDQQEKDRVSARYAQEMEKAEDAAKQKYERALKQREDDYTANCRAQAEAKTEEDFAVAAIMFENKQLRGYRDSDERARQCRAEESKLKAEEAERQAEEARQRAEEKRKEDEAKALAKQQAAKARKKLLTLLGIVVAAVVVVAVLVTQIILPKQKLNRAMELIDSGEYDSAYALFEELGNTTAVLSGKHDLALAYLNSGDYETAYVLLEETGDNEAIQSSKHDRAIQMLQSGEYDSAYALFEEIGEKNSIASSKFDRAADLLESKDYDAAYALLEEIGDNETIAQSKYDRGVQFIESKDYEAAYSLLNGLNYKDSAERLADIMIQYNMAMLPKAAVGDAIVFGSYEQDNDTSNGEENIEWLVLAKEDDRILVISKYALDCQQYNSTYTGVTWETCSLRKWINNDFLNTAFSDSEQGMIPTVIVKAEGNSAWSGDPGNDTQDKVFLLSIPETNRYFSSDADRQCIPTAFAKAQGCYVSDSGFCQWWLRSPAGYQEGAIGVGPYGSVLHGARVETDDYAVRPAMWIDLDS